MQKIVELQIVTNYFTFVFQIFWEKCEIIFFYPSVLSNLFISSRQEILNYLHSLPLSYIIHFH